MQILEILSPATVLGWWTRGPRSWNLHDNFALFWFWMYGNFSIFISLLPGMIFWSCPWPKNEHFFWILEFQKMNWMSVMSKWKAPSTVYYANVCLMHWSIIPRPIKLIAKAKLLLHFGHRNHHHQKVHRNHFPPSISLLCGAVTIRERRNSIRTPHSLNYLCLMTLAHAIAADKIKSLWSGNLCALTVPIKPIKLP